MNSFLKYKLDSAGIAAFVIGVLAIMGMNYVIYEFGNNDEFTASIVSEVIINIVATFFGAISGGLTGFLGKVCADAACKQQILFGDAFSYGVIGLFVGQFADKYLVREGKFEKKQILLWNASDIMALIAAFIFVKPLIDYVVYDKDLFASLEGSLSIVFVCAIPVGILLTILLFFLGLIIRFILSRQKAD